MCSCDSPMYLQSKTESQLSMPPIWFKQQPQFIRTFLPTACKFSGIPMRGNHGMRASTGQRLHEAEVPNEQIIEITGHPLVQTLGVYETNRLFNRTYKKRVSILHNGPVCSASQCLATQPLAVLAFSICLVLLVW